MRTSPRLALLLVLAACPSPEGRRTTPSPTSLPARVAPLELERPTATATGAASPVLEILRGELRRSFDELGRRASPPPYFLAYQVTDTREVRVSADLGALQSSSDDHRRVLDVDVRVGDHRRDNRHGQRWSPPPTAFVPLDDDALALRHELWLTTERAYPMAVADLGVARGAASIETADEDDSDDFSVEPPVQIVEPVAVIALDRPAWEARLRRLSAGFIGRPGIIDGTVALEVSAETRWIVNSEGSAVQTAATHARIIVWATTTASDGMQLHRMEAIDAASLDRLPADDAPIAALVAKVGADVAALHDAPLAEPYAGPAILEGRAAAVLFHEIFGHRVEGHRQRDESEGQTFARKIGAPVMPELISVRDVPTAARLNGVDLNGHYRVDDEAVPVQDTLLVDRGVLRSFLLSRTPTRGFLRSNGHGRRQPGNPVVARQGNLIVEPARVVSHDELVAQLLAEVGRQGLTYGLRFVDIEGGQTSTARRGGQLFQVEPILVYRVYPDGHEELVRGANIEGLPLTSLSEIVGAGDRYEIFNGQCGAESGWVPVAAASPPLLLKRLEITRAPAGRDKPPLLPAPEAVSGGIR